MARAEFLDVTVGRRRNMQSNRSKNTKPELLVRSLLHRLGYRFRLHRYDLPGRPDIVFPSRRAVVEVRGCFWHGHGCPLGQIPKSRQDYWAPKLQATRERDASNAVALNNAGWRVHEIWECEIRTGAETILNPLVAFLGPPRSQNSEAYREFLAQFHEGQGLGKGGQRPC